MHAWFSSSRAWVMSLVAALLWGESLLYAWMSVFVSRSILEYLPACEGALYFSEARRRLEGLQ